MAVPVIEIDGPAEPEVPAEELDRVPFPPAPEPVAKPDPGTEAPPVMPVLLPPPLPPFTVVVLKVEVLPFTPARFEVPAAPPAPTVTITRPETDKAVW